MIGPEVKLKIERFFSIDYRLLGKNIFTILGGIRHALGCFQDMTSAVINSSTSSGAKATGISFVPLVPIVENGTVTTP